MDICGICREETNNKTSCNHYFHQQCLEPWLSEHKTCPLCRFALMKKDIFGMIKDNDYEGVKSLINEEGFDIDEQLEPYEYRIYPDDEDMMSPLIFACDKNKIDIVKLLLDYGAKIDYIDISGCTALSSACWKNNIDIVKLLLEYGANTNILGFDYKNPLFYAFRKNNRDIANLLLQYGADINYIGPHHLTFISDLEKEVVELALDCINANDKKYKHNKSILEWTLQYFKKRDEQKNI